MDDRDAAAAAWTVVSSDGLRLAASTRGVAGTPIVFLHGYPDTKAVWEPVVDRLGDGYRAITYDMRGAGASSAPSDREGYRIARLVDDLVAVMDALSPAEPVHVVGHDWGSIVAWDAACRTRVDERLAGRIASLTSISGPCLGHVAAFYRAARRAPWRSPDGLRLKRDAVAQTARSWYVYAFGLPTLSDAAVRIWSRHMVKRSGRHGRRFGRSLPDDAVNGLNLYRANVGRYQPVPGGPRTSVPSLLIVPTRDRCVRPQLTSQVGRYVPNLERVELDAGHWAMWSRPDEVAELIADHVSRHAGTT
jgi:pimeloyl-ACP methyl ester carboxylesterase